MKQFGVLALGSRLKRLRDSLVSEVEALYKQLGIDISSTHFPVLRLLQQRHSLSVVEIAEALGISHPAVSKQINKLLKDELVVKVLDESDQRRSLIHLSDKALQELNKAAPAWSAMQAVLEEEAFRIDSRFLDSFAQFEQRLLSFSFKAETLSAMERQQAPLEIVPWEETYRNAFKTLNMAWLESIFPNEIYEKDRLVLSHPQSEILAKGGYIWFAKQAGEVIGTCALVPTQSENAYEIIKLAVSEKYQGRGIGMRLMLKCIEQARIKGAQKITLETNKNLKPALHLYQRLGFSEQKPANGYSVSRADLYMELYFPESF
ncbi:GNAT family N-acetyltransferase [Marinomonas agarivorans]|nr:GNAT family N-acetyltransferase [Marinomonas agarivorans]